MRTHPDHRPIRLQRHESALHRWEMAHAEPAGALRAHVGRYCGYEENASATVRRREVPSGDVTLIVSLGSRIDVIDPVQQSAPHARLGSFVAPLSESAAITEYTGRQHGLEAKLTPLGARRLFGIPMHELTNQVVELHDVWGANAPRLAERLHDADGWAARFDVLDGFLAARLEQGPETRPELSWAWGRLRSSGGRAPIAELVRELGWSHRRLIAEFRDGVGMAPKAFARMLRFDRVIRTLRAGGGQALAEIAFDAGYSDQSHFNRDFRRFAATTPGEYAASLMPAGGGVAG